MMLLIIVLVSLLGTAIFSYQHTVYATVVSHVPRFLLMLMIYLILYLINRIILYPWFFSPLRKLPHPKQPPVWQRLRKEPNPNVLAKWANDIPNHGLIRYYGYLNQERVLVTRPQGCKEVLQTQGYHYLKHFWALEVMGQVVGDSLLVAPPEKHKIQRKLLQPAFKAPYIKKLFPVFWTETTKFIDAIEKSLPGLEPGPLDIGHRLHHITLDIIALTGFGASMEATTNPSSKIVRQYQNLLSAKRSHVHYRFWALLLPGWIYRRLPMEGRHEIETARSNIRADILALVRERRKLATQHEESVDLPSQGDIIATLLRSSLELSDDFLIGQAIGFIVAGQEATSVATAFALYLLSRHRELQDRLRTEIRENLPSPSINVDVSATDLESLPFLTAVCNEALRLYTPIPDMRRETSSPNTVIEGTKIPVGTMVGVLPWVVHRSTAVWGDNASSFYPDRWLVPDKSLESKSGVKVDPLGGSADPYSVMTFAYGPRACIGEKFARGEMAILLAQLVGRFDWRFKGIGRDGMDPEFKLTFGVTVAPRGGGMTMIARKIEGW